MKSLERVTRFWLGITVTMAILALPNQTISAEAAVKKYTVKVRNKSDEDVKVEIFSTKRNVNIIINKLEEGHQVTREATVAGKRRLVVYEYKDRKKKKKVTDKEFYMDPNGKGVIITIKGSGNYDIEAI